MQKKPLAYFFSQPHQPFFTWGMLNAVVVMLLFLLDYKGIVTLVVTPNLFHAYTLIFIVFTAFFQGFLLTTFPRFSQMPPLARQIYTTNFMLLFTGTLLFLAGAFLSRWLMLPGMLLLWANQLFSFTAFYRIYRASGAPDKHDQFWILTAFGSGILTHLLLIVALFFDLTLLEEAAKQLAIYLYLVFVALSVAQRMIPFFSHVMIARKRTFLPVMYALFGAGIALDLLLSPWGALLFLAAGIFAAIEIYRWHLPFRQAEPILWILHLAIFWLPVALIAGAIADIAASLAGRDLIYLDLHLVVLGFVTTVLIGFGTRVTLGHSGNMMVTDDRTRMLFYMTQIVIYMRVLYSLTGTPFLFDIAAGLWIALFGGWALKYMPALVFGKKIV